MLADAPRRGATQIYCLGDLGAFGPHPDKVFPLLRDAQIPVVQGNYDNSVGNNLADCQCGYTDPKDNYFARLSYDYTFRKTAPENKMWMRDLPNEIRLELNGVRILLCHGSPRKDERVSLANDHLGRLSREPLRPLRRRYHRRHAYRSALASPAPERPPFRELRRDRPPGKRRRDQRLVCAASPGSMRRQIEVEFIPLAYDHERLAAEMRAEKLPNEFIETIETGWWTTCLEVLPMKERARGIY